MTSRFEQPDSPAVRTLLNAYRDASWAPNTDDPSKHYKWCHRAGLAAALRAAARLNPGPFVPELFGEGWDAAMGELRNIATELKAP